MTRRRSGARKRQKVARNSRPSYPHDSLFKKIFKRPDYCRSLLKVLLTPSFYALFDWGRLKIMESVATGARGQGQA